MVFLLPSIAIMLPASSAEDSEGLPSSFDQRDLGIVTPPKNQDPWGVCWAFGGIAAAETSVLNMLGTTWEESGLDFSERHLSYFSNNHIDDSVWPSQAGEGVCIDLMKITKVETSIILFNQGTHHAKNPFTTGLLGGCSIGWREDSL